MTSTIDDTREHPLVPRVRAALHGVNDPEIRRPITELGMVDALDVDADGHARVRVLLTVSGCPMKDTLTRDVTAAVSAVEGISGVEVDLGVMSDEQRTALRDVLKGGTPEREIPFAEAIHRASASLCWSPPERAPKEVRMLSVLTSSRCTVLITPRREAISLRMSVSAPHGSRVSVRAIVSPGSTRRRRRRGGTRAAAAPPRPPTGPATAARRAAPARR